MQTTKRQSAQVWREAVARFTQSGLTEEAFCQAEGLGQKLFHRWRFKRGIAPARASAEKTTRVPGATTAEFVDLGPLRDRGSRLEMRLDLGGGVLLHVVRG